MIVRKRKFWKVGTNSKGVYGGVRNRLGWVEGGFRGMSPVLRGGGVLRQKVEIKG